MCVDVKHAGNFSIRLCQTALEHRSVGAEIERETEVKNIKKKGTIVSVFCGLPDRYCTCITLVRCQIAVRCLTP